jgi:hypothetical protein
MAQTDTVFAGSIPAFYDRYLGPLLFAPYAADLAARLANITQGQVLETAAGTGGRFIFSVWDRLEENELSQIVSEAVAALFPEDPPRFLARTPYAYYDIGTIRGELAEAGFSSVAAETVQQISRAPSPREAVIGLCEGSPLRNEIEARDPTRLRVATDAAARAVTARFGQGPVSAKMQAHVIIAAI